MCVRATEWISSLFIATYVATSSIEAACVYVLLNVFQIFCRRGAEYTTAKGHRNIQLGLSTDRKWHIMDRREGGCRQEVQNV